MCRERLLESCVICCRGGILRLFRNLRFGRHICVFLRKDDFGTRLILNVGFPIANSQILIRILV